MYREPPPPRTVNGPIVTGTARDRSFDLVIPPTTEVISPVESPSPSVLCRHLPNLSVILSFPFSCFTLT
jgi:hypothetical protein